MDEEGRESCKKKMYVMCVNLLHTKAGLEEKKMGMEETTYHLGRNSIVPLCRRGDE